LACICGASNHLRQLQPSPGHSLTPSSSPSPARRLHNQQQQSPVRHGVDLWAVTKEGDVLTRLGVTSSHPEGASWRHVATDQPFKCISVGEENCVWGVSADGAAWYRSKMTPATPQGEAWIHVGKPGKDGLYQLSAGSTVVWAVDSRYQLWLRKDVTPSTPGGTAWLFVSFNVKHVSCGFLNQTWIISNSLESPTHGSVYRRIGITPDSPVGVSWDKGIGVEWNHVTTRGCIPGMSPSPPPPLPPPNNADNESRSSILSLAGINLGVSSPSPDNSHESDGGGDHETKLTMQLPVGAQNDHDIDLQSQNIFTSVTAKRRADARRVSDDFSADLIFKNNR